MVSCAMPLAPVMMRSPASTGVPRVGVERWPFALVSVTSPTTNVNSPAAARTVHGAATSAARRMRIAIVRPLVVMALSRLVHLATDHGGDLGAVEVVDVDVRGVLRIGDLEAQRALVTELPCKAEARLRVPVVPRLDPGA